MLTVFLWKPITYPRKKKSLGESLAESHAYKPIQDSRRDSFFYAGTKKK